MKFKSKVGKQVMLGNKILTFTSEEYETEDKGEIKALESAMGIEKVESRGRKPKED